MGDNEENHNSIAYQFNGKIMIGSVAILFVACFVIVLFHVYLRWCRSRLTRHQNRLPTRYLPEYSIAVDVCPKGLDLRLIKSLPTFVYSTERDESPLECAVCLSEFEENETGRVLPECNHSFHVDCVDMWLQSHSDCPLCRAHVKAQPIEEPVEPIEDPHEVVIVICINEPDDKGSGSNSGSQSATQKH